MISLMVDKIKVNGPKVDGGYSLLLEVGEYEQAKIAEVLSIPQPTNFKVIIEPENVLANRQKQGKSHG